MRRTFGLPVLLGVVLGASAAADEGMWLFNKPPMALLKERYGFEPTTEWLEHVQKSSARFSSGGSASVISPNGLVMTNHHVGSDYLEQLSTSERNLLETGFFARTPQEEHKCQDLEVMILWSIEDVTDRVKSAVTAGMSAADANTARRKMMTAIEEEAEKRTGLDCQVVTLYQGGWYHLYSYKRYTDVRLVMAPEQKAAFFGGDTDNFEFPRFNLDMCFFRIYENDKPLKTEHYLRWSKNGSAEDELVFVSGHPGRTRRMYTVDHFRFLRDVEVPALLRRLWRREVQLQSFSARSAENARIASGDRYGVENSRKAYTGILAGLQDPAIFSDKKIAEDKLRSFVESNPDHKGQWGAAWSQITKAEAAYREFHSRYSALEARGRGALPSQLYGFARHLVRLADEKPKPNADRLREYRDSELDSLYLSLYSEAPIYDALETDAIASGFSFLMETFGAEDPTVAKALAGQSPRARAEALIRETKLKDVNVRKQLAESGKAAIDASKDALIRLAADLDAESRALRKRYEDEIEAVERDAYAKLAAAQFAAFGETQYPDATFTLRLAFGTVKGYEEHGQKVAPFTTMGGMFRRFEERGPRPPFDLPPRWLEKKERIKLDTPFNFVCTADIIGGNSGSPVINRAGEVVGLIFDGNIQSLVLDIAFTQTQARAVAVDSRAIVESLRSVYDMGALADEIAGRAGSPERADAK